MMLYPAIADLEKVTNSRYALVILTAKRARQLLEASESSGIPLTDKPVKLAINDIASGKVTCRIINYDDVNNENSDRVQNENTDISNEVTE